MRTNKTDTELKEDVSRELAWDTRLDSAAIGVSVHLGVVTLTGVVASWSEKHDAELAAQRVVGVCDIANDIDIQQVWTTARRDADIALLVRAALESNRCVRDETIRTAVSDHAVTLTGSVRTVAERDEAERVVRELDGVVCVENRLLVEAPSIAPAKLRAEIRDALQRHVAREVDRITVDIDGDCVVLGGTVDSWAERRAVLGAAKGTRGVRIVDDRMRIG